jgi:hypothetical protein
VITAPRAVRRVASAQRAEALPAHRPDDDLTDETEQDDAKGDLFVKPSTSELTRPDAIPSRVVMGPRKRSAAHEPATRTTAA